MELNYRKHSRLLSVTWRETDTYCLNQLLTWSGREFSVVNQKKVPVRYHFCEQAY